MDDTATVRILSLGFDPVLMTVRGLILRTAGYEVVEVMSCVGAMMQLESKTFDLVVICHTIPPEQLDFIVRSIADGWPNLPILCLSPMPGLSKGKRFRVGDPMAPQLLNDVSDALPYRAS
jgi:DNA-binding response OmpR family regulator